MIKKGVRGFLDTVEKHHEPVDVIVAALLALCQLLQHYIGPIYNMGITALSLIAVYLIIRLLGELPAFSWRKISFVLVMVLYQLFRIVNHGTSLTESGQSGVFIVVVLALAFGKINTEAFLKVCRAVSVIASCILIVQTVVYYLFGVHLQVVVTSWLIPAAEQWIGGAQTGLISITGKVGNLYRPTAFFLEPAHVYIYMFPHLILLLMKEKLTVRTYWMAALISCGMVLCTSGMGVAAVVGAWAFFFMFRDHRSGTIAFKNLFSKKKLIVLALAALAAVAVVLAVPPARKAILRIFVPNNSGTTAISGRISQALKLVGGMSLPQWILGVADNAHDIEFHMPGLIDVLYRHGLIGLVLSYELYVKCIWKLPAPYKLLGAVILVTSVFSAHTHSTIGMLYFLIILMDGFRDVQPQHPGVKPYELPEGGSTCPLLRVLK